MTSTGIVLCLESIRTDNHRIIIKYYRCQIMTAAECTVSNTLYTCRQTYQLQVTVIGEDIRTNVVNMIRSDRIRDLQTLYRISHRTGDQFIGGVYHISRSSSLSAMIRILYCQLIFVLVLVLFALCIVIDITECETVILGKGMDRAITSSFKIEGSINRFS